MQYFGRAIGSVSKTWNSINPATLSGAIDVIVVEDEKGDRHCSPFHVRFGKFQLLRPSQKKVTFIVNGEPTDIPMKLNDEGEAFFVFKTDGYVPEYLQTSPVVSAMSSPSESPRVSPSNSTNEVLEYLDIGEGVSDSSLLSNDHNKSAPELSKQFKSPTKSPIERAKEISKKLNIPSKVEANGDIYLDMDGYKSNNKDVHDTDIIVHQILEEEFGSDVDINSMMDKDMKGNIRIFNSTSDISSPTSPEPPSSRFDETEIPSPTAKSSSEDIINSEISQSSSTGSSEVTSPTRSSFDKPHEGADADFSRPPNTSQDVHFKTLRLTSEQLKYLSLNDGENDITYSVNNGKSIVTCKLFLWKRETPIVISDIDGTITKSDALGHVLTMLGRDWTHEGVAKLFDDIEFNGYNIMYLTARSVGLADTTRSYLQGVEQDGYKLPVGPVILSPDRTIAALRREIVLKKPEVFKMACLNDIRALYYPESREKIDEEKKHIIEEYSDELKERLESQLHSDELSVDLSDLSISNKDFTAKTNETTGSSKLDGLSQEQLEEDVGSADFTDINTNTPSASKTGENKYSEMKNEHLGIIVDETNTPFYAGFGNRITDAISYRSVGIPSSRIFTINPEGDVKMELLELAGFKSSYVSIVELVDQFFPPVAIKNDKDRNGSDASINMSMSNARNKYTDFNYWRSPDIDLSLISDDSDEDEVENGATQQSKSNIITDRDNNTSLIIETNDNDKEDDIDSGNVSKILTDDDKTKDKDRDEVKSIGSRFSFFMRSPILSPRKSTEEENKKYNSSDEEEDLVDMDIRNIDEDDDSYMKKDTHYNSDDNHDISLMSEEEEEEGEDESDSDYIYETSDDEENEFEEEEEEAKSRDIQKHKEGNDNAIVDEGEEGFDVKLDPRKLNMNGMKNGNSRSSSVSGISGQNAHGKFV